MTNPIAAPCYTVGTTWLVYVQSNHVMVAPQGERPFAFSRDDAVGIAQALLSCANAGEPVEEDEADDDKPAEVQCTCGTRHTNFEGAAFHAPECALRGGVTGVEISPSERTAMCTACGAVVHFADDMSAAVASILDIKHRKGCPWREYADNHREGT